MSAEPLLLLSGLLCDDALWAALLPLIPGRKVHIPPLAGADTMAALAEQVLQAAPPRFALAGLSMGGYLAFELLRQAPARITRLCLLATTAAPDDPSHARRRRALIGLALSGPGFAGVTPRLLTQLLHPDNLADEALRAAISGMAARIGRAGYVAQQRAILSRPDSRPDLAAIAVPTLVLVGEADSLTPPDAARHMARAIAGARLCILPGCGHLPPLERPLATAAAMAAWLAAPSPLPIPAAPQ